MLFDVTRKSPVRPRVTLACVLAVAAASLSVAWAETTYTDGSFGVSINLPDNTSVTRIKNPAGETGTEIAQFTLPEGNVVGRIVVSDLPEKLTFDKAIADVRNQLATDSKVPDEKVTAEKGPAQGNFKNAVLLQAWDQEHTLLNGILVVQGPSDQMLIMYVAMHDIPQEDAARKLKQIASGFTVLLSAGDEKRVQAAKLRGPETLTDLISPPPPADDLWEKQFLLMSSGKDPVGYIVVRESVEERAKRPGLALRMERWSFWPQGGGAEYESQKAFATWDLHDDEWSSHMETVIEIPGQPARMITSDQSVVRLATSLMIETIDPQSNGKPAKRVIPYPRTVVPQAWRWLLPRLFEQSTVQAKPGLAGDWIALLTYSPLRRGMEMQMFSRATHGAIHQVLQREGLYGVTENWQFDSAGALKQISSTDVKLTPTTEKDVNKLFGPRIAQWKAKVKAPGAPQAPAGAAPAPTSRPQQPGAAPRAPGAGPPPQQRR